MEETIKIIIVDDHTMFREGLAAMLKESPNIDIVGNAASGPEVFNLLEYKTADLIITDLSMPEMDGLELTKLLSQKHPTLKVLVLTMHNDVDNVKNLLDAGAAGYLLKNTGKQEFLIAIKEIINTGKYFSEEIKNVLVNSMMKKKSNQKPINVKLTQRESEILSHIALELTNAEISEKLFISLHTVETHRRNIMRKLNVHNGVGLLRQAIQLGLVNE